MFDYVALKHLQLCILGVSVRSFVVSFHFWKHAFYDVTVWDSYVSSIVV